jgi:arylformamidase
MTREASRERYAPGYEFHIGRIDMVANTGTYVDSPFHRYEDGRDMSELPIESVADLESSSTCEAWLQSLTRVAAFRPFP